MNPERARELTEKCRNKEEKAIKYVEEKIEKFAKKGRDNVLVRFKTATGDSWRAQKCYEVFKERGFDCHWEYTNGFRIKW